MFRIVWYLQSAFFAFLSFSDLIETYTLFSLDGLLINFFLFIFFRIQIYIPTGFDKYSASFEVAGLQIFTNIWDTSGKTVIWAQVLGFGNQIWIFGLSEV